MNKRKSQTGMVLVIGLIFLLLMTVMSIAAMQTGGLDERMASNANDHNIAFQAAEVALRRAENFIAGNTDLNEMSLASVAPDSNNDSNWTDAVSVTLPPRVPPPQLAAQPIYVIRCAYSATPTDPASFSNPTLCSEQCYTGMNCYRVTARGQGTIATSVVVLETIFRRPLSSDKL
ncbi:hypothetical protein CKO12_00855 [Chromatium okenii]|uniref:pilus assembly PilX family protein n=1 Tax=Chromatium okenii TaxID=61644 RepID=UPI001908EA5E|nr:PilX N-terminal domain-containing pilus assembly protein [Chromatium okenii]MBK1640452.1 hypothetical protein [Chromatium okenii]